MSNKQIPAWYKIFVEKRIKKLEIALEMLNNVEILLDQGYLHIAAIGLEVAKEQAKGTS